MKLQVAKNLALPADTVTSTLIVYGGKGMGKTNFGSVLMEELAKARLRFRVIDPMGVWWGLRHDEHGKGKGIEVLILGGIHGDIPIEPTGGAVVADLAVDEDVDVLIDISRRPDGTMWSIGERVRFVTDYCKRLYQRQGEKRRPMMQIIDEAARFIPQVIRKGEEQVAACMGAIAVLVEEGRNVGIGCGLITQRSARLNKDVAELADMMVAFRTVGPNSLRAVLDWLGEHVEKERIKKFHGQIRALPKGTALVVSPGWLEFEGIVAMRARQTFDSSKTPKPGEDLHVSGTGAKPDLEKYAARMKETIDRAKAEDPKALRKRIAELETQLKEKAPKTEVKIVEKPVVTEAQLNRIEKMANVLLQAGVEANAAATELRAALGSAMSPHPPGPGWSHVATLPKTPLARHPLALPRTGEHQARPNIVHVPTSRDELSPYAHLLLRTLAQRLPMKLTRGQLAALSGRSARSSGFDTAVAKLRKAGLIDSQGTRIVLTEIGLTTAGLNVPSVATSPDELRKAWLRVLPDYERSLMEVISEAADGLTREEIGERSGKSTSSSGFDSAMASLRRNGLVRTEQGISRATDEFAG